MNVGPNLFNFNQSMFEDDKLLLTFEILVEGQSVESYNTPSNVNGLIDAMSKASMYRDKQITVIRADEPRSKPDFIGVVETNEGQYWSTIDSRVENIKDAINNRANLEAMDPVPVCGTVDEIVDEYTTANTFI
jgi:hypothetical protein